MIIYALARRINSPGMDCGCLSKESLLNVRPTHQGIGWTALTAAVVSRVPVSAFLQSQDFAQLTDRETSLQSVGVILHEWRAVVAKAVYQGLSSCRLPRACVGGHKHPFERLAEFRILQIVVAASFPLLLHALSAVCTLSQSTIPEWSIILLPAISPSTSERDAYALLQGVTVLSFLSPQRMVMV